MMLLRGNGSDNALLTMTKEQIYDMLREVLHPGKGDRNIVELGIVADVTIEETGGPQAPQGATGVEGPGAIGAAGPQGAEGTEAAETSAAKAGFKVTVTLIEGEHRDPLADYIQGSVRAAIYRNTPANTEIAVKVTRKVAEGTHKGTPEGTPKPSDNKRTVKDLTMDELNNVRHIIGIASGKGGVGKSTVAVNLAVALARLGCKVGLADADVYGPSVPIMTGTEGAVPEAEEDLIFPIEKYGVKWMSIGYFANPGQALIWRGPMACNALKQMILQVRWGVLDFLLIDMPPGTGDIHISLVNDIPMEGAVMVTTPQDVALSDV